MRDHAHTARWLFIDGTIGTAILAPSTESWLDAIKGFPTVAGCRITGVECHLSLFCSDREFDVKRRMTDFFFSRVCPICLNRGPCWFWREAQLHTQQSFGRLLMEPMRIPDSEEQNHASDTIRQILDASANLRTAVGQPRRVEVPRLRQRPEGIRPIRRLPRPQAQDPFRALDELETAAASLPTTIHEAPTPAGTVRCHTCGQVIPPGFSKETDTKRTDDEIYAECEHDFDPSTSVCRKCKMQERGDSRFSRLEID